MFRRKLPDCPLQLASEINLHLAKDAVILIDDNLDKYPVTGGRYQDSVGVRGGHDIAITGEGTIDGQGEAWWKASRANQQMMHRPYMVRLQDCSRVLVEGVTLTNSPMFHLVPDNCTDVTIRGMTIKSPSGAPNTDGIDPSG